MEKTFVLHFPTDWSWGSGYS